MVKNIPFESKYNKFKCDFCDKVCISKRGLTRHVNCKHKPKQSQQLDKATCSKSKRPEEKMHPLLFKNFLEVSAKKLSLDECYPSDIMDEFKAYSFWTLDDVLPSYNLIRDVVDDFNGDAEKFYPKFYNVFAGAEAPFQGLCRSSSLLPGLLN